MQWLRQRGLSLLRQSGVAQGNFGVALAAPISRVPAEATPVGGIWEALRGLAPSLTDATWLAVPKKRVTAHRRGNRNATKFIRFVPVVAQCSKCQKVFQQHSVPRKCAEEECPSFVLRARPQ